MMQEFETRIHLVSIDNSFDDTKYLHQLDTKWLKILPNRGHLIKLQVGPAKKEYVVCKVIWTLDDQISVDMEVFDPSETASYCRG